MLADLQVRSWKFGHRGLLPDEVVDAVSVEEREASWRERLADPAAGTLVLVTEVGDTVAGFVSVGPAHEPSPEPGAGEIYELFVHPDFLRRGVGSALLLEAMEHLKHAGSEPIILWVVERNQQARRFYERMGLRPDGTTKIGQMGPARMIEVRYISVE